MPIGTRLSTPIPRSYLHDERLNSITDPLTREAFFRAKLIADNLGRLPANPVMLAGILFPGNPPNAAKMGKIIEAWSSCGLVFHYQAGQRWFVEIADNGSTSRLIGHMTDQSEYPAPPSEMIAHWKEEFSSDWKPIERKSKRVKTGSNKYEHVPTRSTEVKRSEVNRSEGKGVELEVSRDDETADDGTPDRDISGCDSDLNDLTDDNDNLKNRNLRGRVCVKRIADPFLFASFVGLDKKKLGRLPRGFEKIFNEEYLRYQLDAHQNNESCCCDPVEFLENVIQRGNYPRGLLKIKIQAEGRVVGA